MEQEFPLIVYAHQFKSTVVLTEDPDSCSQFYVALGFSAEAGTALCSVDPKDTQTFNLKADPLKASFALMNVFLNNNSYNA